MLRVSGQITILVGESRALFTGHGDRLVLDIENLRAFLRESGAGNSASRPTFRLMARELYDNGLTAELQYRGRSLAVIGHKTSPGIAGWILGVPHLQISSASTALRAFLSR